METKEARTEAAPDFNVLNSTLLSAFRRMVDEEDWARARGMVALFPELEGHWEHVREKCNHLHRARVLRMEDIDDGMSYLLYSKECMVEWLVQHVNMREVQTIESLYAHFGWEMEDDPEECLRENLESVSHTALEFYIHIAAWGEYRAWADEHLQSAVTVDGIRALIGLRGSGGMYTRITYNYTSGSNYKQSETFWVLGVVVENDLRPYLEDGMYFTAHEVGLAVLPLKFSRLHRDEDHPWHHFTEIIPSSDPLHQEQLNKVLCTAGEFVQRFKEATWDEHALEDYFDD